MFLPFALRLLFALAVVSCVEIAFAFDAGEIQFLSDMGTSVCQDPTNYSKCQGLTLNKNEHITGMCAQFLFQNV